MRTLAAVCAIILALVVAGFLFHARRAALDGAAPDWTPVTEQHVSHGRFDDVAIYVPHGTPQGFVLLMSGEDGWTPVMDGMARGIAAHGAMVAGLDNPKFNAALEKDGGQCVFPDGDLENLSRFVQAYFHLPTYLSPILAGYSTGATLAYATLVQAPKNTFAGAVSVDFCPTYPLTKPLCKDSGIEFTPHTQDKGVDFLPSTKPAIAWSVIQPSDHPRCDLGTVRSFVAQVPGARFIAVKGGTAPESGSPSPGSGSAGPGSDSAGPGLVSTELSSAIEALIAEHPAAPAAAIPSALSDLPIVLVPAETGTPSTDTFAIILSGDGGWAGLDKDVAGALTATGIPVIGLDSLRYFWSARTPAGLATDLDRLAGFYLTQLGKQRVLLIGYSQGADVLPFAVNRLNASIRSHVALTAVMGMSEHALFEFHMTNWVSDDDSGPATLPEVDKITGIPVLCIYGEEETDTLCPKLDPHKATIVKLKGGHHFDGNYPALAKIILSAAAH